jgi:hypothetical protein
MAREVVAFPGRVGQVSNCVLSRLIASRTRYCQSLRRCAESVAPGEAGTTSRINQDRDDSSGDVAADK